MKKINTIFLAIIFTVLFSVNLFPAEAGGQTEQTAVNVSGVGNITDEEMGWPNKLKMEFKEFFEGYRFIIFGKKYNIDEIKVVFDLTDNRTKQLFYKAHKAYHSNEYIPGYDTMPIPAVESFNAFIASGSPETIRLKEYLKKLYIEKKKKDLKKRQEEIREGQEEITSQNSITRFIGGGLLCGTDFSFIFKIGYFYPVYKAFKLGFVFDAFIRWDIIISSRFAHDKPGFLGASLSFAMKIDWFYFTAGGYYSRLISKDTVYSNELNYANDVLYIKHNDYGIKFGIGWMRDKKLKIFVSAEITYGLISLYRYNENNYYSASGFINNWNFNLSFGIGW